MGAAVAKNQASMAINEPDVAAQLEDALCHLYRADLSQCIEVWKPTLCPRPQILSMSYVETCS